MRKGIDTGIRLVPWLFLLLLQCTTWGTAQISQIAPSGPDQGKPSKGSKPPLDLKAFSEWPAVNYDDAGISNDGQYVYYRIRIGWRKLPDVEKQEPLHVMAGNGSWKTELTDVDHGEFSEDSRKLIFLKLDHNLCLLTLGTSTRECIANVESFRQVRQGSNALLAYQLLPPSHDLLLWNVANGVRHSFPNVGTYSPSPDDNFLALETAREKDSSTGQSLILADLRDGSSKTLWRGVGAGNVIFDRSGEQLAFAVEKKDGDQVFESFWYYKQGTESAVLLADDSLNGLDKAMRLHGIDHFSEDGTRLFVRLKEVGPKPDPNAVKVNIWSYTDPQIYPDAAFRAQFEGVPTYSAVLNIQSHRLIRLAGEGEVANWFSREGLSDDWVIVDGPKSRWEELDFSTNYTPEYVVSTRTGERKRLPQLSRLEMSPDGECVVGYGPKWTDFYSYEITTGITRNITNSIVTPQGETLLQGLDDNREFYGGWQPRGLWQKNWLGDGSVLISDSFDLWKVDPSGRQAPINLTNHYGRRHHVSFQLAQFYDSYKPLKDPSLVLEALDLNSKNDGFYEISLATPTSDPELLTMGPYVYGAMIGDDQLRMKAKKARDTNTFLVSRESAVESANLFWSSDLKRFKPITDVHPERAVNWLTSKLVSFRTLDGRIEKGILYRPEDFDPKKKYPVIFQYYELKSDQLNMFPELEAASGGEMSIPWFVSHDYLVFVTDIRYPPKLELGHSGRSAYDAVVGAAKSLSQYPWVDSKHMAIQGHSYGGWETYYLVTHTDLFAAALASCGMSDLISHYGSLWGGLYLNGVPEHGINENRQQRMRYTLWERPDLYIENSPVLQANKVTTPILSMANRKDGNVSFQQAVEWFTAMRRLGKRAWMLEYDDGRHGVHDEDYIDYTVRTQQFFDHYLKGLPPAKWMTQGVPPEMKSVETGLELDTSGREPQAAASAPPDAVIQTGKRTN